MIPDISAIYLQGALDHLEDLLKSQTSLLQNEETKSIFDSAIEAVRDEYIARGYDYEYAKELDEIFLKHGTNTYLLGKMILPSQYPKDYDC